MFTPMTELYRLWHRTAALRSTPLFLSPDAFAARSLPGNDRRSRQSWTRASGARIILILIFHVRIHSVCSGDFRGYRSPPLKSPHHPSRGSPGERAGSPSALVYSDSFVVKNLRAFRPGVPACPVRSDCSMTPPFHGGSTWSIIVSKYLPIPDEPWSPRASRKSTAIWMPLSRYHYFS